VNLDIQLQNFEVKANESHVRDIIYRYKYILPLWLRSLTVEIYDEHSDAPEGTMAWNKARPEYGFATICILSRFLDKPEKQQRSFILHEMLHIAHRREYNFVWDRLLNPVQNRNEELHKFLVEDYRQWNEEFINQLTYAILSGNFHAP
jgi:hypothetical protein